MERISLKKIIFLSIVLASLAGYFFVYEAKEKTSVTREKKVFQVLPEDVNKITFYKDDKEIICEKKDGSWFIEKPISTRADDEIINNIISEIEKAKIAEIVEKKPSDLSQFGLTSKKAVRVKIKTEKGEEEEIIFGDFVPLNKLYVYAKKRGNPEIFTVYYKLKNTFNKTLYELRDKKIIRIKEDEVERIKIVRGSLNLTLEKEKDTWQIVQPVEALADEEKVNDILDKLEKGKIRKFIRKENLGQDPFGPDTSLIQILLFKKGETTPSVRLFIGKRKDRDLFYAKKEREVLLIEKGIVESLPESIDDIRQMHALKFNVDKISKIEIIHPESKIIVEKKKNIWEIKSPLLTGADDMAVKRLLWGIKNVKVESFLPANSFKKIEIMQKPEIAFCLWEEEKIHKLNIFASKEGKIFGTSSLQKYPFVLKKEIKDKLFTMAKISELRDRHLLNFNPLEIEKIEIRHKKNLIVLEKKKRRWKIKAPFEKLADNPKIWKVLFSIKDLEFKKVIKEKLDNPLKYGFQSPLLEIALWEKGGEKPGIIKFGSLKDEKSVFVTSSLRQGVYLVDSDFLAQIPEKASDVEYRR